MKTTIEELITGYFRVHWKDGEFRGGYRDFPTLKEAEEYKTLVDAQDLINLNQGITNNLMNHFDI